MRTNIIRRLLTFPLALMVLGMVGSCGVDEDFPHRIIPATITGFEVEGQCDASGKGTGAAEIDIDSRIVHVYVSDTINPAKVLITKMTLNNKARITPDADKCLYAEDFPEQGFEKCPDRRSTLVDFTSGKARFTFTTYQDYSWSIYVDQVVNREVRVQGQVGEAVIDPINQSVVIYVDQMQDLTRLKVEKFNLCGDHGRVYPDPTQKATWNFSRMETFQVTPGWKDAQSSSWKVFVYHTDTEVELSARHFARSVSATISGSMPNGTVPTIEYRQQGQSAWQTVLPADMTLSTANYSAELNCLKPGTTYEYRTRGGKLETSVQTFETAPALQLPNASFDEWSISGSGVQALYQPWKEGGESYWDTGNRGATTVGASNSTYLTEGGRTFANLQSKYIVIKFAAGNIFAGQYLKTDGANGVLSFGRPFTSFPTKMRFDYKYKTGPVNKGGGKWDNNYGRYISKQTYDNMKGQPDSCQIYIALIGDQDEEVFEGATYPFIIRTKPSALKLFNPKSNNVIAYAQLTQGNNVSEWKTETLTLNYRHKDRVPKYIMVVASSSKYGDYFLGSDEALMQLDNIQLLYE